MSETTRKDVRKLLKTFGIQADEAMINHLEQHPEIDTLNVRLVLEDLTVYEEEPPEKPLRVAIKGNVRR